MNEAGNEAGSVTVGLPDLRRGLLVQRTALGANTPAGRRCSNIDEMLQAGAKPADIARQVRELAALLSKGNRA